MNKKYLHNALVEALSSKIPQKTKLADFVAVTLCITKESAYRRLRADVHFSFEEAGLLAEKMSLSLDQVIGLAETFTDKKLNLQFPCFSASGSETCFFMKEGVDFYERLVEYPYSEYGGAFSMLPFPMYTEFPCLTRFFMLKYMHHADLTEPPPFDQIKSDYEDEGLLIRLRNLLRSISYTYYVWSPRIISDLVNDIQYARSMELLKEEDVSVLKREIYSFLNKLEAMAAKGKFKETGNKFELYISPAYVDVTYTYAESDEYCLSALSSFVFLQSFSRQKIMCRKVSDWVKSLKRHAVLVSGIAERERILFFEKQRKLLDAI